MVRQGLPSQQLSAGYFRGELGKLEQASAPAPPANGLDVLLPGRLPASLPPPAVKPIAILQSDGWEYHRGDWPPIARQRMALQRSGRYMFWGASSWADVGRELPSGQDSWSPKRPGSSEFTPPSLPTGALFCTGGRSLCSNSSSFPDCFPSTAPARPRRPELQLLMAYLLNPSERWLAAAWPTICQAQARPHPASRTGAQHGH